MTEVGRMLLEEGRAEGKIEILVTQLTAKFKNVTEKDIQAIKKLSPVKRNIINIKMFDM